VVVVIEEEHYFGVDALVLVVSGDGSVLSFLGMVLNSSLFIDCPFSLGRRRCHVDLGEWQRVSRVRGIGK